MSKRRIRKKEYSKRMATILLIIIVVDIQVCIASTFFDKEIPTEICVALITEGLGVYVGYLLKAYFGKKAEENIRLKETSDIETINLSEEQKGDSQ